MTLDKVNVTRILLRPDTQWLLGPQQNPRAFEKKQELSHLLDPRVSKMTPKDFNRGNRADLKS